MVYYLHVMFVCNPFSVLFDKVIRRKSGLKKNPTPGIPKVLLWGPGLTWTIFCKSGQLNKEKQKKKRKRGREGGEK